MSHMDLKGPRKKLSRGVGGCSLSSTVERKLSKAFQSFLENHDRLTRFHRFSVEAIPSHLARMLELADRVEKTDEIMKLERVERLEGKPYKPLRTNASRSASGGVPVSKVVGMLKKSIAHEMRRNAEYERAMLADYQTIVNEQSLIFLVSIYESYLVDLLDELVQHITESASEEVQFIVNERLEGLRTLDERLRFIGRLLKVKIETPIEVERLVATRNLLVHNRGVVTEKYANRFGSVVVGEKLSVDKTVFVESGQALKEFVGQVDGSLDDFLIPGFADYVARSNIAHEHNRSKRAR